MQFKNLLLFLFFVLFTSFHAIGNDEKPTKKKKRSKISKSVSVESKKVNLYTFDKLNNLQNINQDVERVISNLGGDPILFSITSNSKTAAIGETIEIKVVAQLMDAAAANYFVFEELKRYSLKVVMPKTFIQTGGNYYDYVTGELTPTNNRVEYTIVGKFEGECRDCEFKLLRGKQESNPNDIFVLKGQVSIIVNGKAVEQVSFHIHSDDEGNFLENAAGSVSVTNLRFKDPCVKYSGNTTFLVDIENNGSPITLYAYLCYGNNEGLTVQQFTIKKEDLIKTIELTYPVSVNANYVHVHFLEIPAIKNDNVYPLSLGGLVVSEELYFSSTALKFYISAPSSSVAGSIVEVKPSNCPSRHKINWYSNGGLVKENATNSEEYKFTISSNTSIVGECFLASDPTCKYPDNITVDLKSNCNELPNPVISSSSTSITNGESFTLKVSNCTSQIKWKRNDVSLNSYDNLSEITVGQIGSYTVSCLNGTCSKSAAPYNPTLVPLKIEHDVVNNEIIQNQYFQLRAVGCYDGKIDWELPNGTKVYNQSDIYAQGPGVYKARCVSRLDNNIFSDWVIVSFVLKSANRPSLIKSSLSCVYANQTIQVTGTCPAGMTIVWGDGTSGTSFPMYKYYSPGTYYAKCCNGTNCSTNESLNICVVNPELTNITSNKQDPIDLKTYSNPTESVLLTGSGCDYGTIRWELPSGQAIYGNPVTVYGPGLYKARCFVTENSFSNSIDHRIYSKPQGAVSIISSQAVAHPNQLLTLTAQGCNTGFVEWTYTVNGIIERQTGKTIDVLGPNSYTAKCISFGVSSLPSTITIPQAPGNVPKITVDKSRVRPNETFSFIVDYSGCINSQWWGGQTLVTQNGVTRSEWGLKSTTVTGPAVLEAQCGDRAWDKATKEIFLAPGDNLRLVSNKSSAKATITPIDLTKPPGEPVLLTTYGCDYGYVEWQIGTTNILGSMADPKRQITQYGPGIYKARCREDFSINSDYVTVVVTSAGNVTPVISGSNRMCPNTANVISTNGCPNGYYNVWNTIEFSGWAGAGNSITIYTPQTVKLRCNKNDDSFASEESTYLIEPAFPDDLKAKNNGPVVLGGTAIITATDVPGATYLWTPPIEAVFTNSSSRILQMANVTDKYAGEYNVKVTYAGCSIDLKTKLEISACDNLYIRAFDPISGLETNKLTRKLGVSTNDQYEDLVLQVETLDGKILKTMDYTWDINPNLIKNPIITEQYNAKTAKMGNYRVNVSKNTITCPLSIDIFAEPCTVVPDVFNCGSAGGAAPNSDQTNIPNLAVGDEFTTSDYTIVVTEASGSSTGWTGKGKLIFNFLKLTNNLAIQIPISVTFDGIKVNQCYQLYFGKVITQYDPSWSSVVSADQIKNQLSGVYTQIKDLLVDPTANIVALQNKIKDLRAARADLANAEFTAEYKAEQLAALDAAITGMICLVGEPPASGSRMSVVVNSNTCDPSSVGASVEAAKAVGENSQINKWAGDVFDESGIAGRIESESKDAGNFVVIKSTKNGKIKYDLLSEYHSDHLHDVNENWKIPIKKLMTYYYGKIINPNKPTVTFDIKKRSFKKNLDIEEALAFCELSSKVICIDITEGFIHTALDNKNVLLSVMTHEQYHAYDLVNNRYPVQYYSNLNHLNVYLNQIKAANFLLAPEYYKTDTFTNILDYFNRSLLEDTGPNNNELYNFLNKELNVYCLNNFNKKIIQSEGNSFKWSK